MSASTDTTAMLVVRSADGAELRVPAVIEVNQHGAIYSGSSYQDPLRLLKQSPVVRFTVELCFPDGCEAMRRRCQLRFQPGDDLAEQLREGFVCDFGADPEPDNAAEYGQTVSDNIDAGIDAASLDEESHSRLFFTYDPEQGTMLALFVNKSDLEDMAREQVHPQDTGPSVSHHYQAGAARPDDGRRLGRRV
jgi:hypothetical protein